MPDTGVFAGVFVGVFVGTDGLVGVAVADFVGVAVFVGVAPLVGVALPTLTPPSINDTFCSTRSLSANPPTSSKVI